MMDARSAEWPRGIRSRLESFLGSFPVVILEGARAVGKSHLCRSLVRDGVLDAYSDLTLPETLAAARSSRRTYVQSLPPRVVIDEAQLLEGITLDIKNIVDADPRPGRFLLTGSARLGRGELGGTDALAGRAVRVRLYPMTQGELAGAPSNFIARLFDESPPDWPVRPVTDSDIINRIVLGGFPSAHEAGINAATLFDAYRVAVMSREFIPGRVDITIVDALLRYVAINTSGQYVEANVTSDLQRDRRSVRGALDRLADLLLVNALRKWPPHGLAAIGTHHKLHIADTGLGAALALPDGGRLVSDRDSLGRLLETFVVNELLAQASWADRRVDTSYFREKNHEIDLILERSDGAIAAIEVKAAHEVGPHDFAAMRAFERTKRPLQIGIILHLGERVLPFGNHLWAVPLSALWASTAPEVAKITPERQTEDVRVAIPTVVLPTYLDRELARGILDSVGASMPESAEVEENRTTVEHGTFEPNGGQRSAISRTRQFRESASSTRLARTVLRALQERDLLVDDARQPRTQPRRGSIVLVSGDAQITPVSDAIDILHRVVPRMIDAAIRGHSRPTEAELTEALTDDSDGPSPALLRIDSPRGWCLVHASPDSLVGITDAEALEGPLSVIGVVESVVDAQSDLDVLRLRPLPMNRAVRRMMSGVDFGALVLDLAPKINVPLRAENLRLRGPGMVVRLVLAY